MDFFEWYFVWNLIGVLSCVFAISVFRKNGTTTRIGELYLAVIGPFFGPIIFILALLDLYKKNKKLQHIILPNNKSNLKANHEKLD